MGVSIKDVARTAGVSTATVSRVINHSEKIADETRQKILKVMKDLNYVPNTMARDLSNQKASNITLLIDGADAKSFSNPFFYEVMHGIESVVYQEGLTLMIASSQPNQKKKELLKWLIQGKRLQGLIIPSSLFDEKTMNHLEDLKCPFVVLGETRNIEKPHNWVDIHNSQGAKLAVAHLVEKGYRKIAYLGGHEKEMFNFYRQSGFKEALQKYDMTVRPEMILQVASDKQQAYEQAKKLLEHEQPDAFVCGDNIISLGAMNAIKEKGYDIPAQVGLVSFDDYPLAELLEPSLTSVVIDVFELGVQAAKLLLQSMEDEQMRPKQSLISTSIHPRESTGRHA